MRELSEEVRYGFTASSSNDVVGPKFLRITDIVPENISWESVPYAKISESDHSKYRLKHGDIVVARTGATTGYAKWLKNPPESVFASYLVRFRVDPKHHSQFIGYVVQSDQYKRFIKSNIGGAAQPQANAQVLGSYPILTPPLPTQQKIASILSAYDDLIENNNRRIQILEEMAQRIYREWFVHFRFPGHENVKMVDSELGEIPKAWRVGRMGSLLSSLETGKRPRHAIGCSSNGVPSIGAENVIGLGKYNYQKEKFITADFFETMNSGVLKNDDILLYKDGAQIGRKTLFRNKFPHSIAAVNEHVFILRTCNVVSQIFAFLQLERPNTTKFIQNLNTNTAQPGINRGDVNSIPIIVPPKTLITHFDSIVNPLIDELFALTKRNMTLRKTRDLLLPRLISGRLDVEELDIKA